MDDSGPIVRISETWQLLRQSVNNGRVSGMDLDSDTWVSAPPKISDVMGTFRTPGHLWIPYIYTQLQLIVVGAYSYSNSSGIGNFCSSVVLRLLYIECIQHR